MRKHFVALSAVHRDVVGRVAANTRALRAARGWTQLQAAEATGLSLYGYQLVEAGETSVTTATLAAICEAFESDVLVLFAPAEPPPTRPRGRPRGRKSPEDGTTHRDSLKPK
jgi:transcriptional regulator with XRE-family HTH domain